jgi:hypothetical protein
MLRQSEIVRQARQLYESVGARAEAIAAQRATRESIEGHRRAAEDWTRIRNAIRQQKGPHQA